MVAVPSMGRSVRTTILDPTGRNLASRAKGRAPSLGVLKIAVGSSVSMTRAVDHRTDAYNRSAVGVDQKRDSNVDHRSGGDMRNSGDHSTGATNRTTSGDGRRWSGSDPTAKNS